MKFYLLFLLFSCSNQSNTKLDPRSSAHTFSTNVDSINKNLDFSVLKDTLKTVNINLLEDDIQKRIIESFNYCIQIKNCDSLNNIHNKLIRLYEQKNHSILIYWISYTEFYQSIYYLNIKQLKLSERTCDIAIENLTKIENKNSEEYALLASIRGFSLQFKGMKVPLLAMKAKEEALLALESDSLNLRANYVFANNDFFTPKIYGGGKDVEKFLLKAISLPNQQIVNNILPSWGKVASYDLLIRFYIKENNIDAAKKITNDAISKFPENLTFKKYYITLYETK